ncbi:probable xyloglucan endotransglucosylase/hydrolase protein 28 [Typha latifolia]|uniref:probable xyloglucan endotransglucosylase/hydrolase protein 28 n=1 Tax=Typha latifolia TaxID=4733 RepID=UPI003C2DA75F
MGSSILSSLILFFTSSIFLFYHSNAITTALHGLQTLSFEEGYTQIFGDNNLMLLRDGKTVHISLDKNTGAGFASQDLYLHGFFSASIKLPSDYAAGVVVAFYMSNGDVYEKNHDELDFEFLGNVRGREWRLQTNVYGNGSTSVGREERYDFWFDPTEDFHQYSILWSHDRIIFYIDNIPIRQIARSEAMGGAFPSKPMSLYATIWDGSKWATLGGRYKVNYKYAPYVAEFADLILRGCAVNPMDHSLACDGPEASRHNFISMSSEQQAAMETFRRNHITYSYCYDRVRYVVPPPECETNKEIAHRYGADGLKIGDRRQGHGRNHRNRSPTSRTDAVI